MRLAFVLLMMVLFTGIAHADFFESNNPFPMETRTTEMQNIYATDPAIMNKEQRTKKKMGWWNKTEIKIDEPAQKEDNNGSFYVFPSGK